MSIIYSFDILCDGENCAKQAHGITRIRVTPGDAREYPAQEDFRIGLKGWVRTIDGKTFCAECLEIYYSAHKATRDARLIGSKTKEVDKQHAPVAGMSDVQWEDF